MILYFKNRIGLYNLMILYEIYICAYLEKS